MSETINAERIKRLEHVLEQLKQREEHEVNRQSTADSKLTGALAIIPIIVGLVTTSFFEMLPHAARLGLFGTVVTFCFFIAIVCFLIAAAISINGLWPNNNPYHVVALRDILKYREQGTYREQLLEMSGERGAAVRANREVNNVKLGRYMDAQKWIVAGLALLTLLAFAWALALAIAPSAFLESAAKPITQSIAKPSPAFPVSRCATMHGSYLPLMLQGCHGISSF
jgi:sterol desaturase/sphingolipid hydroxylase (fatty acid hydroxylase superfamily)